MKSNHALAICALTALLSSAAQAGEAVPPEQTPAFHGSRTRAEVMAEAAQIPRARSNEPAGSRVAAPVRSTLDRASVRSAAAEAVRLGKISSGEIGSM